MFVITKQSDYKIIIPSIILWYLWNNKLNNARADNIMMNNAKVDSARASNKIRNIYILKVAKSVKINIVTSKFKTTILVSF